MRSSSLLRTLSAAAVLMFASSGMGADTAEELIQKGDGCSARFQSAEALKYFLPAQKLDPNNARRLVRIAQQYRHLMSDASKREEKVTLGTVTVACALRALALAPKDPEVQLAVAISYGKLLPLQSSKDQFDTSPLIKAAADKAIALDPGNDLIWHVLGRWYFNVAEIGSVKRAMAKVAYGNLPTAKYEDAVRCFQKAIDLNPNRLMHHIEIGRTYAQMKNAVEARKFITKGLAMAETEKDDPETKERGRQILAKLH